MEKELKYVISPITTYEDDHVLYATKVGVEGKNMPLHYTVWGKTAEESRIRAEQLSILLSPKNDLQLEN